MRLTAAAAYLRTTGMPGPSVAARRGGEREALRRIWRWGCPRESICFAGLHWVARCRGERAHGPSGLSRGRADLRDAVRESRGRGVLKLTVEQQAAFVAELPEVFEPVQGGWGRMGMTYWCWTARTKRRCGARSRWRTGMWRRSRWREEEAGEEAGPEWKRPTISIVNTSLFELFKIGIGPSSSHTVGPMRAALRFVRELDGAERLDKTVQVAVDLYGSLALTGKGHGTDRAVLLGLMGEAPDTVDPATVEEKIAAVRETSRMKLGGQFEIPFR